MINRGISQGIILNQNQQHDQLTTTLFIKKTVFFTEKEEALDNEGKWEVVMWNGLNGHYR